MLLTFKTKESMLRHLDEYGKSDSFLIVRDYKSLASWNLIPLRPLTILLGPNSSGKSTVYSAVDMLRTLIHKSSVEVGQNNFNYRHGTRTVGDDFYKDDDMWMAVGFSCRYDIINWETLGESPGPYRELFETVAYYDDRDIIEEIKDNAFPFLSKLRKNFELRNYMKTKRYTLIFRSEKASDGALDLQVFIDRLGIARWMSCCFDHDIYIYNENAEILFGDWFQNTILMKQLLLGFTSAPFLISGKQTLSFGYFPYYLYLSIINVKTYDGCLSSEGQDYRDEIVGLMMFLFNMPITGFLSSMQGEMTEDVRTLTSDWQFIKPKLYSEKSSQPTCQNGSIEASFISKRKQSAVSNILLAHEAINMIKVADENIYSSDEEKLISNKNDEKPVRYLNKINNWLSEKAFFDMKYRLNCEVMQCIDIGDFGPSYTIYPQYVGRLLVVDKAGRSLRFSDVGTGVAQVIPILIDLALDKALLYRQPEVHLHPKLQTKIADCFVQQVNTNKGNREFKIRLIETHSEHFVLRIIRRLKDSFKDELLHSSLTVYSEDFSLLYFKPFDDYSEIHEIRVSEDGAFIDAWPDGFFDDSDDDLWRILS